jgi:hypothetical protein
MSFDPGDHFNINTWFSQAFFKSKMKIAIKAPTAPAIKKMAFNFAKSKILYSVPAPLPVLNAIDYVISNQEYIKKNKSSILMHPKKIAKSLPGFAMPDIMNSDYVHDHVIDQLHGVAHDVVVNGIHAIDFFHTLH